MNESSIYGVTLVKDFRWKKSFVLLYKAIIGLEIRHFRMNLLFMKSLWSKIFVEKKFRFSSTKQSLDVKIDTFEWIFYLWCHFGQSLSLKKKASILLYLAIIGLESIHEVTLVKDFRWKKSSFSPLLSGNKVALGVPFEYDNFTNFFSNSHIWHFSRFILSCDMKLDLSISVILRREKCYK